MNAILRWLRAPLCALLIATPLTLGVIFRHERDVSKRKLESVCAVLTDVSQDFKAQKDYVSRFVTTPKGKNFIAGLPVPPKPDC